VRSVHCGLGSVRHPFEEEINPSFPVSLSSSHSPVFRCGCWPLTRCIVAAARSLTGVDEVLLIERRSPLLSMPTVTDGLAA
jgi:hypothetical protein